MRKTTKDNNNQDTKYWDQQWAGAQAAAQKRQTAYERSWYSWSKDHQAQPYTAWLVLPCNLNDYGLRPLPPGTPYWASPFITVESPDPSGNPVAGAENYLVAQVFNLGAATAAPTRVDFYWADPSVGLSPGDFTLIGTEWVQVEPLQSVAVRCSTPWIPSYLNNGHECAMVNVDNHILDPLINPFEPWADRHVGQRNLHVLPATAMKFILWAPMGSLDAPAQLNVMAFRGVAPGGFIRKGNEVATLGFAAQQLLAGMRAAPAAAGLPKAVAPHVFGELFDHTKILRSATAGSATRALAGALKAGPAGIVPGQDVLLRLPHGMGAAVPVEIEIAPVDLAVDEVVVLNITHTALGAVTGGYTLVLANHAWFKKSPLFTGGGAHMRDNDKAHLQKLVIEHNPEARITYQLSEQLEDLLPLKSLEHAKEALHKGVEVEGQRIPADLFLPHLSEHLFPIDSAKDLVHKLSAAVRIALQAVKSPGVGTVRSDAVQDVLESGLGLTAGQKSAVPTGHFGGPSVFGSTPAKGGK